MLFFARKVLRKKPGDWTFLIVTDRAELDDQIAGTFAACGELTKLRESVQAQSREHLKELLRGNERYIFTLIQKFGTARGEVFPELSTRSDIIVITDEAHRSQYDILAANMRAALPNAAFIGFTGTPLIAGEEERTREVFGDYVSIYDFAQSIADGATVPLYYESRLPELHLTNEQLGDDIARVIDEANLGEDEEDAIARRFAKQYHLITNDDRLDKVAADLVRHFSGRGYRGKAMFIAIDKATAIRMYDKVRRHWAEMLAREAERVGENSRRRRARGGGGTARVAARDRHGGGRQPVAERNRADGEAGADIEPHRRRMVNEDMDEKFKAPNDPLRLVFVCAMWITGFDVPTCSTIYLDKPMKNHTLMQTIARANRVAPGKQAGLIVDYVGVFRNLKEALAIYAQPRPGVTTDPIEGKDELVEALKAALGRAVLYAEARSVKPADVLAVSGFERQAALKQAAENLLGSDDDKRAYLRLVGDAWNLFRAVLPDPAANEFRGDMIVLKVVAEMIRTMSRKQPGKTALAAIAEIERLIDEAIAGAAINAPLPTGEDMERLFDLSTLDFERLAELFAGGARKTATEILRGQTEERARALAQPQPDAHRPSRTAERPDRALQRRQHGRRAPVRGTDRLHPHARRGGKAPPQGGPGRGRTRGVRHPHPPRAEADQGRGAGGQENRARTAREAQAREIHSRLAAEGERQGRRARDDPAGIRSAAADLSGRAVAGQGRADLRVRLRPLRIGAGERIALLLSSLSPAAKSADLCERSGGRRPVGDGGTRPPRGSRKP